MTISDHPMVNYCSGWWIDLQESAKSVPGKGFPLASSVHPLEETSHRSVYKIVHRASVKRYSVILDMTSEFAAQDFPQFQQFRFVASFTTPLFHCFQFAFLSLLTRLDLWYPIPFSRLSPIECEA